jgi:hypothetical protein
VELRIQIHGELAPMGALETVLVNRIAAQQWRLARIPALEAELFERMRYDALGNDQGLGAAWARDAEPYGGALARLSRYETMLERNGARLLGELRRLQTERRTTDQREWQAQQQAEQAAQGPWWERAVWPGGPTGAAQELARPTDETPPRTADAVPPLPVHGEGAGGGVPRQAPNVGLPPGWPGPTPEERAADQARAAAYAARQAPSPAEPRLRGEQVAPHGEGVGGGFPAKRSQSIRHRQRAPVHRSRLIRTASAPMSARASIVRLCASQPLQLKSEQSVKSVEGSSPLPFYAVLCGSWRLCAFARASRCS